LVKNKNSSQCTNSTPTAVSIYIIFNYLTTTFVVFSDFSPFTVTK
jgi:hypothetical protein